MFAVKSNPIHGARSDLGSWILGTKQWLPISSLFHSCHRSFPAVNIARTCKNFEEILYLNDAIFWQICAVDRIADAIAAEGPTYSSRI
mmetsp:Transcript_1578/g.3545  ORF Transcript_1578/g.3545 Transcript_1578/m.3545 type:complete len:88 (+) Transcript_1578:1526-1789(+)